MGTFHKELKLNGLKVARKYYEEFGEPMLEEQFPEFLPKIAVGLTGAGSECFGFDDESSRDHDFEPGFLIFLPDEDVIDRKAAFALERAYAKLPKEFMGLTRNALAPVGGMRRGVVRAGEYYTEKIGSASGILPLSFWLSVPEYALAEATNGEIFRDDNDLVTSLRARLADMPEDARRKRLAGRLLLMGQSGQYNYSRCLAHGETGAAQLACAEFVKNTMSAVFLLNRSYMPFYKWGFRAMRGLPKLSVLSDTLEYLLSTPNDSDTAQDKAFLIEETAGAVIGELRAQALTEATCGDLEKHAYSVNDGINDPETRNLHVLVAT